MLLKPRLRAMRPRIRHGRSRNAIPGFRAHRDSTCCSISPLPAESSYIRDERTSFCHLSYCTSICNLGLDAGESRGGLTLAAQRKSETFSRGRDSSSQERLVGMTKTREWQGPNCFAVFTTWKAIAVQSLT